MPDSAEKVPKFVIIARKNGSEKTRLETIQGAFSEAAKQFSDVEQYPDNPEDQLAATTLKVYFETIATNIGKIIKKEKDMVKAVTGAVAKWNEEGVTGGKEDGKLYEALAKSLEELQFAIGAQVPPTEDRAEHALYRGEKLQEADQISDANKSLPVLQKNLQKLKHLIPVSPKYEKVVIQLTDTLEVMITMLSGDLKSLQTYAIALEYCPGGGANCAKTIKNIHAQIDKLTETSRAESALIQNLLTYYN